MVLRPSPFRPIRVCAWLFRVGARSLERIEIANPTPFIWPTEVTDRSRGARLLPQTPIGHSRRATPTRFPEYISARAPIPQELHLRGLAAFPFRPPRSQWSQTPSLMSELRAAAAFPISAMWTRGVDTGAVSDPTGATDIGLPRPIFVTAWARAPLKRTSTHFCPWTCRAPKRCDRQAAPWSRSWKNATRKPNFCGQL